MLHEMDHKAFLSDCRKVIADFASRTQAVGGAVRVCPPPNCAADMRLPESIRQLKPRDIGVTPDFIHIELAGGFVHYGFEALREGAPPGAAEAFVSSPEWIRLR